MPFLAFVFIVFLFSYVFYCPNHFKNKRNKRIIKDIHFNLDKINRYADEIRVFLLEGYDLNNISLQSYFNGSKIQDKRIKIQEKRMQRERGIFGGYNHADEYVLNDILSSIRDIASEYEIEIKHLNQKEKIIQELIDKCTTWEITRDKVVELEENGIPISLDSDLAANIEKNYNTIYQLCIKKNWRGDVQKCLKKIRKEDMKLLQNYLSDFAQEEVVAHIEDVAKLDSILKS